MNVTIPERVEKMEDRMESMERHMVRIDVRLDHVERRLDSVDLKLGQIDLRLDRLHDLIHRQARWFFAGLTMQVTVLALIEKLID
jgi:archaellum component FlaC